MRAWIVLAALLVAAPLGDRPGAAAGKLRVGIVDILPTAAPDAVLEDLVARQRYVQAFEHSVSALETSAVARGPLDPGTLTWLHRVGTVAFLAGDLRTAEEVLDTALEARRRVHGGTDPRVAETLYRRGYTARYKDDRALARRCYDEAWRILDMAGEVAEPLRAGLEQAEADWSRRDDMNAAIGWYRRALERRRRVLAWPSLQTADNLTWLGWSLARDGRFEEAKPILGEARAQLEALGLGSHSLTATIDHAVADILVARGDLDAAEPLYRRAAATFEAARGAFLGGFARAACPLDGFDAVAAAVLKKGRPEEAWRILERSRGASFVDFATLGLWKERDPAGFRAVDEIRREQLEIKRQIGLDRSRGSSGWDARTWPRTLRCLRLRSKMNVLEMGYLERNRPRAASLEDIRKVLGPKDALIGWLDFTVHGDARRRSDARSSYGWGYVLRSQGPITWVPLWAGTDSPDEGSLHFTWAPIHRASEWPLRVDSDPETIARLRGWTRVYLDPLLPYLRGVERLIVETTREPLAPLVAEDGSFVGDAFDLTYTPSVQALTLLRSRAVPPRTRSVLSVAGPSDEVSGRDIASLASGPDESLAFRILRSSLPRDETVLDRLPRLPFARLEAESVARHFHTSSVLFGGDHLEHRLWDLVDGAGIGRYDVVHVATHTLTDNVAERCALALERHPPAALLDDDGMVDLEEIVLGMRLNARLVTLSGCETARAAGADRGEVRGFAPALLAAGARNVLSSMWPVDDRATTILMDRFYENLTGDYSGTRLGLRRGPMSMASALREAQMYLRNLADRDGKRRFEHPVYWAGFILLGLPESD